jgi:hypothetical protein
MEPGDWLQERILQVREDPRAIRSIFPAVARRVGARHEEARIQLLEALPDRAELADLYRYGDAHERRAVILAIVGSSGEEDLALVRDAFRSNDPRLVTAAAAAAGQLADDEVDQVLMKCVFMGIPLEQVPMLADRATGKTARMVAGFVLERVCAGRDVAPDVWAVIDRYPPEAELAQIGEQLHAPDPERRRAASAALAQRRNRACASSSPTST